MKIENQVTNLQLSKRLKELKVKQESCFYWSKAMDNKFWRIENSQFFAVDERRDVSAFTVAELGEILPHQIKTGEGNLWQLNTIKINGWTWGVSYESGDHSHILQSEIGDTEADARAKTLISLLKIIN